MKRGIVWWGLSIAIIMFVINGFPHLLCGGEPVQWALLKSINFLWWWHLILVPFYLLIAALMVLVEFTDWAWAESLHTCLWGNFGDRCGYLKFRWGKVGATVLSRVLILLGLYYWRIIINNPELMIGLEWICAVVFVGGLCVNRYIADEAWDPLT